MFFLRISADHKIKYQLHAADDPDYEPPPPPLTSSFFAWLSPVVNVKERQMLDNIGAQILHGFS